MRELTHVKILHWDFQIKRLTKNVTQVTNSDNCLTYSHKPDFNLISALSLCASSYGTFWNNSFANTTDPLWQINTMCQTNTTMFDLLIFTTFSSNSPFVFMDTTFFTLRKGKKSFSQLGWEVGFREKTPSFKKFMMEPMLTTAKGSYQLKSSPLLPIFYWS